MQLHPYRHRFTAYRLRFGYGYTTVIFPTWLKKQQQHQSQRDDEIIDALLDVTVSLCQSNDHHVNNSIQSETTTASTVTTTTSSTTPSYYEPNETILDSIGETLFSTTTNLELHYHWMPQSTIISVPVIKERTNICICNEDEHFPGCVDDYELIADSNSSDVGGSGGGGDGGNKSREYSLPRTIINTLPLGARVGRSSGSVVNASSHGGGVVASIGGGPNVNPAQNDPANATSRTSPIAQIVANTGTTTTTTNAITSEVPSNRQQPPVQSSSHGSRRSSLKEDETKDSLIATTAAKTVVSHAGKNSRKKEMRKMHAVKDRIALTSNNTTTVDNNNSLASDQLKISPSPARATVAFDIENSPRSLKRRKVDDEDMQQNDAESRKKSTVERVKDAAKQAPVAHLDDSNQPNQGATFIDSENAPLVMEREPPRKKANIHTTSEKIARDLAMAVAEAQKDAFAAEKRVPCRARRIPDHNPTTAYIIIPEGIKHGDKLLCSHPDCRDSRKFRYCEHCKGPVIDANFRGKHSHGEEPKRSSNENKRDDADETRTGGDHKRGGDDLVGKAKKEEEMKNVTKPRITKFTTSKDPPTDTAQAGRGPSAFTLYVEEVRPMFRKTHPNLTPAELVRKLQYTLSYFDVIDRLIDLPHPCSV